MTAESEAQRPSPEAVAAVCRFLEAAGGGVIIGGVAVSLVGKPRLTADVDAMLVEDLDRVPELIAIAARAGLRPRWRDTAAMARQNRLLAFIHTDSGTTVDVALGAMPFESEVVARRSLYDTPEAVIPVPSAEDLIILKSIAHRDKDMLDIGSIADTHPDLDKRRIRSWLQQFGEVLDMPEIWEDVQRILEEVGAQRPITASDGDDR